MVLERKNFEWRFIPSAPLAGAAYAIRGFILKGCAVDAARFLNVPGHYYK